MQTTLNVKTKILDPSIPTPALQYAKHGDAGMDLTVTDIEIVDGNHIKYKFGIAIEIPLGYVGLVFPRSSIYKQGQLLTNSVGVIDSKSN